MPGTKRTYRAKYRSPGKNAGEMGTFEFESAFRAGTKGNMHDARLEMLERFGSEAVAWQIHNVELTKDSSGDSPADGQAEIDFRPEAPRRRRRRFVQRGRL